MLLGPPVTPTSHSRRRRQCTLNAVHQDPRPPSVSSDAPKTSALPTRSVSAPVINGHGDSLPAGKKNKNVVIHETPVKQNVRDSNRSPPKTTQGVVSGTPRAQPNGLKLPVPFTKSMQNEAPSGDSGLKSGAAGPSTKATEWRSAVKPPAKQNMKKPPVGTSPGKETYSKDSTSLKSAGNGSPTVNLNTADQAGQKNAPTLILLPANRVIVPIPIAKQNVQVALERDRLPQSIPITKDPAPVTPKKLGSFIAAGNKLLRSANHALAKLQEYQMNGLSNNKPQSAPSCARKGDIPASNPGDLPPMAELASILFPALATTPPPSFNYGLIELPWPAAHGEPHTQRELVRSCLLNINNIGLPAGFLDVSPQLLKLLCEMAAWSKLPGQSNLAIKLIAQSFNLPDKTSTSAPPVQFAPLPPVQDTRLSNFQTVTLHALDESSWELTQSPASQSVGLSAPTLQLLPTEQPLLIYAVGMGASISLEEALNDAMCG
ncbi:hypothetical protein PCANC_15396 [Puccinia coronata f. sp. avenae]|uniref:Uncharacterized protein n=1 Tax=Puccinia coronata f. sp. avenae TaxID=200324 RepID=A0A2N5SU96_9BASI|nr:hypothetical protein PCANC_15396 [Puccinia coronata f. sp. avenae]